MRDIDRGGAQPLLQRLDLGAHLDAQLGVEVGERLVEQEHLRVAHDRPAHGDALALAAGELARIAVEQRLQAEDRGGRCRPCSVISALLAPRELEREAHVLGDGHLRIERVVLEHHGDVAVLAAADR